MTPQAWITLFGMFLSLVVMGGKAYLNTRDRLTRIEAKLNNGMTHDLDELKETVAALAAQFGRHLGWAEEKARAIDKHIGNEGG